jgi:hypothetical protein
MEGQICTQERAIASNNVLPESANFNEVRSWNIPIGSENATVLNTVGANNAYYGIGACKINFLANGEVKFNTGDDSLNTVIGKDGNYILSYAFYKSDEFSDINFTVEVLVNDVVTHTITQNLYFSSGYTENQWNVYFQSFPLEYGDVVTFNFYAQSDTTACYLLFDRFKLELDDKGIDYPTIYTEAPLTVYEEENTITVGTIGSNSSVTITASLTGANPNDATRSYVLMKYPSELIDLGLEVGVPLVTAINEVKFIIHNHSGGSHTPEPDAIYNFKLMR